MADYHRVVVARVPATVEACANECAANASPLHGGHYRHGPKTHAAKLGARSDGHRAEGDMTDHLITRFRHKRGDKLPPSPEAIHEVGFGRGLKSLFVNAPDGVDVLRLLGPDRDHSDAIPSLRPIAGPHEDDPWPMLDQASRGESRNLRGASPATLAAPLPIRLLHSDRQAMPRHPLSHNPADRASCGHPPRR